MRSDIPLIASATGSGEVDPIGVRALRPCEPSTRTGWPGLPTTVEFAGTFSITTELAPTLAPWPIVIGPEELRTGADR